MTDKELHILIQQGLQNIDMFRYDDVETEEVDIHINNIISQMVEAYFHPESKSLPFMDIQIVVDDLRVLERTVPINTSVVNGEYIITLPSNYNHLIEDISIVEYKCKVDGQEVKKQRRSVNRLTKPQNREWMKKSYYNKSTITSPLSYIQNNSLVVIPNDFEVPTIIITYSKKPELVSLDINNPVDLEFPDATCYKIAKATVIHLMKITEQNPNKIQLLQQ